MLAVDSTSSQPARVGLRKDLDRLRAGRSDSLKEVTRGLLTALGDSILPVLARVSVVTIDVDTTSDRETIFALELLAENLEDYTQAAAAWGLLQSDAGRMCADRSRRARKDLIDLLSAAGIGALQVVHGSGTMTSDTPKKLVADDDPRTALSLLKQVELDFKTGIPDGSILYRLNHHKAAAYLLLGQHKDAILYARRALDHDPSGVHALINLASALSLDGQADEARLVAARATSLHPQSPHAWLVRQQAAVLAGDSFGTDTPTEVASTLEYPSRVDSVESAWR